MPVPREPSSVVHVRSKGPSAWLDGCLEGLFYAILALCLVSRSYPMELADKPLTLVLAALAVIPPLLVPARPNAQILSRLAIAIAAGILLQIRLPLDVPALQWVTPRDEPLTVSVSGLLMTLMAVGVAAQWRRKTQVPEAQARLRDASLVGGLGLAALGALWWIVLNRVQTTLTGVGLYFAEWAGALSIVLQITVLVLYTLSVEQRGRALRLAIVAVAALAVRNQLPPSGGM